MRVAALNPEGFCIEDRATPEPTVGQALVRTMACGICGSDLHRFHDVTAGGGTGGDSPVGKGLVLGHEFCGELLDYGPQTKGPIRPGRLVVSFPVIESPQGPQIIGFSEAFGGGFGEELLLQSEVMLEVPNGLSAEHAALTEPMAVGEHAVAAGQMNAGDAAMVVGCGPVGLAVIAALRSRGLGPIIAVDFSATRRGIAETLGADLVIDPAVSSSYERWADFGVNTRAQVAMLAYATAEKIQRAVIFECVGAPGMLAAVIDGAPLGATIVVAGACKADDRIQPIRALLKEVQLRFVNAYSLEEFASTLRRIAEGELNVASLITRTTDLPGLEEAFVALSKPVDAKIMLLHDGA